MHIMLNMGEKVNYVGVEINKDGIRSCFFIFYEWKFEACCKCCTMQNNELHYL